ncbi:hypothetical protein R3I94_018027 [Phoxinus phoxinus]
MGECEEKRPGIQVQKEESSERDLSKAERRLCIKKMRPSNADAEAERCTNTTSQQTRRAKTRGVLWTGSHSIE